MKGLGTLLAVGGIVLIVIGVILAATKLHLTRSRDFHQFLYWLVGGLVLAIIGGVLVKRGAE